MINRPAFQLKESLEEDQASSEDNWMLSYIDVFVLMTTLFIMLVVMNQPKGISESVVKAPESSAVIAQEAKDPVIDLTNLPKEIEALVQAPQETMQMIDHPSWIAEIESVIEAHQLDELVQLKKSDDVTELEISSRVLFDSGAAELTRPGEVVLENLLPILSSTLGDVFIEGHTDDRPIETSEYPSNWELASARATEVLQFFVAEGLARDRFRAVSYADTKPLAPNNSEKNRRKNRRVSLVIHR